jgi:hypothetical protein
MEKNNYEHVEVVFRLKPVITDTPTCEIKHVGYMGKDDKLGDEVIEIEIDKKIQELYGKYTDFVGKIDGYDITVNAYKNNMTGSFIIKNTKLPIMSLQFMYKKNIVVGYLFNIFIYFELDEESIKSLTNAKKYVGARVTGKYRVNIEYGDDLLLDENRKRLKDCIENYSTQDIAEFLSKNNKDLSDNEMSDMLIKDIEEKTRFYNSLLDGYEIEKFKNIKKFVNENLVPLYKNKQLVGLIKFALDVRNKKRLKHYGGSEEPYKIPENILRYKDYKDNEKFIDKYLNVSDSESDAASDKE